MRAGIWCLAAASLGASLAYTGTEESQPSAAYALDREWAANSPLGIDPAAEPVPPLVMPGNACAVCGRVEAVVAVPPARSPGRKPVFEVRVRMQDGQTQTVHLTKSLAVGTRVTLEHGVLRVAKA